MDERIVQFIGGLRAAGVRVSLAESQDAMFATQKLGVGRRAAWKAALKTTLVKEHRDSPTFERLFPLYFGGGAPPMIPASEALSDQEMEALRQALAQFAGRLHDLLQRMLEGQAPSEEQIDEAARRAGMQQARSLNDQRWLTRQTMRAMGLRELLEQIQALLEQLAAMGMSQEALDRLAQVLQANSEALRQQVEAQIGAGLAEQMRNRRPRPTTNSLLDRPFQSMSAREQAALQQEVLRLAARLRTRAALRQKRGKGPSLDPKATLRVNLRHGGVPFEIVHKVRRRKARFTLICDVSTSMRPVVSFLLQLLYHIQDRVSRTRTFAFIDHIEEVSEAFDEHPPRVAIPIVLRRLPAGHYNTDLGASLAQFCHQHLDSLDARTTLIICGDGRNNFNDPRLDLMEQLARRAHRLVWFNPEPPMLWGREDSDMLAYAPLAHAVHQVTNLRQLSEAIESLFA